MGEGPELTGGTGDELVFPAGTLSADGWAEGGSLVGLAAREPVAEVGKLRVALG